MNAVTEPQTRDEILGYHGAVSDFKRRLIEATLHQARGNRTHAARSLGLQRTYLLRLIRELRVAAPPPPTRNGRARPEPTAQEPPRAATPPAAPANGALERSRAGTPSAAPANGQPPLAPSRASARPYPPSRPPGRAAGHTGRRASR